MMFMFKKTFMKYCDISHSFQPPFNIPPCSRWAVLQQTLLEGSPVGSLPGGGLECLGEAPPEHGRNLLIPKKQKKQTHKEAVLFAYYSTRKRLGQQLLPGVTQPQVTSMDP